MDSKYAKKIQRLVDDKAIKLHGNRILIEIIELEQKTASGIILTERKNEYTADRPTLAIVLAVGDGYYHENEVTGQIEEKALDTRVGDIVIINKTAYKPFSDFFALRDYKPDSMGLITEDLIHANVDMEKFQAVLKE